MTSRPFSLLIASLGNPGPLKSTRHSAGHILLNALANTLQASPFARSKAYANGAITSAYLSSNPTVLWQSPTSMNVSGPAVHKAWRAFVAEHDAESAGLVILHDEMETPQGRLRVRKGLQASAKGHNGMKSVQDSLRNIGTGLGERVLRVGIGIGRPISREKGDVSDYVLGQCTRQEKEQIEGLARQLVELLDKEGPKLVG